MPPRYRQLIVMRFFEEYSYEEIAMKLELPLGTVKTQIHRAREQMCRPIAADEKSRRFRPANAAERTTPTCPKKKFQRPQTL